MAMAKEQQNKKSFSIPGIFNLLSLLLDDIRKLIIVIN